MFQYQTRTTTSYFFFFTCTKKRNTTEKLNKLLQKWLLKSASSETQVQSVGGGRNGATKSFQDISPALINYPSVSEDGLRVTPGILKANKQPAKLVFRGVYGPLRETRKHRVDFSPLPLIPCFYTVVTRHLNPTQGNFKSNAKNL